MFHGFFFAHRVHGTLLMEPLTLHSDSEALKVTQRLYITVHILILVPSDLTLDLTHHL